MRKSKKIKKGYILALAALLLLPCINILQAQAAREIVLDQECSLTVSVEVGAESGSNDEYLGDLNQMSIPVSVYRVADVDITGQKYTPTEAFKQMNFSGISGNDSTVTAEKWQELAARAEEIRKAAGVEAADTKTIESVEGSGKAAQASITGLLPGLYLIVPEEAYNPDYTVQYTFTPYLTALPGSSYTLTGAGSDEWEYDAVIGLKTEAVPQFGRLNITKELQNYNETLGPTTFVFRITGVDKNGTVQYEEVESMTYTAAGSNTITLEKIPAGLTVTVEEIYSGASYTVSGSKEETVVIWSDAAVAAGKEGASEASAAFRNCYNGGNRGGYGVTNHFELDGMESDGTRKWTWENPTGSAEQ